MISLGKKGDTEFTYVVEFIDGKLTGFNRPAFEKETSGLQGKWEWLLRKWSKKRTLPQNSTQWWYFNEISRVSGYTPMQIKGWAQVLFLKEDVVNVETGEVVGQMVRDTSDLSTIEHAKFMQEVRAWAEDFFEIFLPEPDKNYQMDFDNQPPQQ